MMSKKDHHHLRQQ